MIYNVAFSCFSSVKCRKLKNKMAVACSDENQLKGSFYAPALMIPILIILQLSLLSQTIYFEYTKRIQCKKVKVQSRLLYISLQIIGLSWTFNDLFRFVLDPRYNIIYNNFLCVITAYLPKLIPSIFYGVYLYQILTKIQKSFAGSYLSMSKLTYNILLFFVVAPAVLFGVIFVIFNDKSVCGQKWIPSDVASELYFCSLPNDGKASPIIILGLLYFPGMNILFGAMFSVKLAKVLSNNKDNEKMKFEMKSLIVKICILVLTGSISTIFCWSLWVAMLGDISGLPVLFLDLFVNCLMVGLMFRYNDNYYKLLCKCCIVMCLRDCDRSKQKLEDKEVQRYLRWRPASKLLEISVGLGLSSKRRNINALPALPSSSKLVASPISVMSTGSSDCISFDSNAQTEVDNMDDLGKLELVLEMIMNADDVKGRKFEGVDGKQTDVEIQKYEADILYSTPGGPENVSSNSKNVKRIE